jgi:crotonobetainyl-CoA:carnitine CoA-transferase CaiB-like acyl-CoA transferase
MASSCGLDLERGSTELPFAPRYNEHTRAVLAEAGVSDEAFANLQARGIVV